MMAPRLAEAARSFSQLSITTYSPANAKPAKKRSTPQAIGSMRKTWASAVAAMTLESVAKVLMWPTRRTTRGTLRQPRMKPAK